MSTATDTTSGIIGRFQTWAAQPYDSEMGIGGWFAFLGLIVVTIIAWGIILHDLKGEV